MEITSRQFGQIEAACFALEEATEKNNTALRLVKVNQGSLSKYLRNGERKDVTGVTEFFGENGGALKEDK